MARDTDQGNGAPKEPVHSKQEIAAAVQAAFDLCATCGHVRGGSHPGDGGCEESWFEGGERVFCECREFWPLQAQYEDGLVVLGHEVALGGGADVRLNRRVTAEFWESLSPGVRVVVEVEYCVEAKGFKTVRVDGSVSGLMEQRKLKAVRVVFREAWEQ